MLTVERLRLSLPPGFAGRAERIARLVGDELAARSLPAAADGLHLDRLAVGPVSLAAGASDRQVARSVADAVAAGLTPDRAPDRAPDRDSARGPERAGVSPGGAA